MNVADMQNALERHDRLKKSTEIPLFYGSKDKDTVLPSLIVDRIDSAAETARWDDRQKCRELIAILREKAVRWYRGLEDVEVDVRNWNQLKEAFLASYEPKFTAKTNCTNFHDLIQGPNEEVQEYYNRITEVFLRICQTRPANMANLVRDWAPAPQVAAADANAAAIAAVEAHNANAMTAPQNRAADKMEGILHCQRFFKQQIFIASLRDEIRFEVMKEGRETMKDTLDSARQHEVMLSDIKKKGPTQHVQSITSDESNMTEEQWVQINAVLMQQGRRPLPRPNSFRPRPRRFGGNCRYCKKPGHMQKDCISRKKAGAPCVDDKGKPWKKVNQVETEEKKEETPAAAVNEVTRQSVSATINTLNW
jgi:hypothetical protein